MISAADLDKALLEAMELRCKGVPAEVVVTDRSGYSVVVTRYRLKRILRVKSQRKIIVSPMTPGGHRVRSPMKVFVRTMDRPEVIQVPKKRGRPLGWKPKKHRKRRG